ncbi:D-arabinono-1,4-lactone oxidase [Nocardioides coralli]|uniref:D-arabinono-1,4-lactone oxidase n=1 Tax=Nocardioides coralli TaxID=2872154 RepID=UPI001CA46703|nr:D-arabinono-1,4-lactone oxidase [Nocardioides coralli]QZY27849.1 FAD-binding protein [Nocardioides coralli]
MEWRNWSGLATARPEIVLTPRTPADVESAVRDARGAGSTVKMVGTGHSFTAIAAPEHTLLLPHQLAGITAVDRRAMTVTALAGTPLHRLNHELEQLGLSLANMGDIAEQTLAGAVSTGTHGSGGTAMGLASQLAGLELVTGTGEVVVASETENPDVFDLARIGLGALGVLTTLTFRVLPLFRLRAHERPASWDEGMGSLLELAASHDHLDAYWFPHTDRMLLKTNDRVTSEGSPLPRWRSWVEDELLANHVFGAVNRVGALVPPAVPTLNRASARLLGDRTYTDVAHRVLTASRRVRFREMEYAVPADAAVSALTEARRAVDASSWRIGFPVEIRVGPGDDVPLSTAHGRDTAYLAFHTWVGSDHVPYFTAVERIMRDHGGRPHWGKVHTLTAAELAPAYPRFGEFLALRERLDPDRVFANDHLRRVLGD